MKTPTAHQTQKIIFTVLLLALAMLAHTSNINRAIEHSFLGKADEVSERYLDESFKRAAYTFAIVRGINGIISVIQHSSVAVSPAGIGVGLAMGEILDPVNDLVERFSWVMLLSTTSLGIQKVLLGIGAWLGFDILLGIALLVICLGLWIAPGDRINLRSLGIKLLIVAFVVRFCIPVIGITGAKIYDLFLKPTYDTSAKSLDSLSKDIKTKELAGNSGTGASSDGGFLSEVKRYSEEFSAMREKIEMLKQKASEYADFTINLIIVFSIQTILLPLAVLWILVRLTSQILAAKRT